MLFEIRSGQIMLCQVTSGYDRLFRVMYAWLFYFSLGHVNAV
jgi:hypothetical protein